MYRRRNFSKQTKRQAFGRSGGVCECHRVWQLPTYRSGCGAKLTGGNIFYEHIAPDRLGGLNDLSNCAVLCKTCWQLKTVGYDRPKIDKARRQRDLARGIRARSKLPGGRDSDVKIRINAPPVYRDTGRPVFQRGGR
jgi:5-methylcytosine-specific restriction enzyme A